MTKEKFLETHKTTKFSKYIFNEYCQKIAKEIKDKYPDKNDPIRNDFIKKEAIIRMKKDNYLDKNGKFINDKDIFLVNKNQKWIARDIDNLLKEINIFENDKSHNYNHEDIDVRILDKQERLKKEYIEYREKHNKTISLEDVTNDILEPLRLQAIGAIRHFVNWGSDITIYKIQDKKDGSYVYGTWNSIPENKEDYIIEQQKIPSEELNSRLIEFFEQIHFMKNLKSQIENEIIEITDIKGPIFKIYNFQNVENKMYHDGERKTAWKSGEFYKNVQYIESIEDLKNFINSGKLDYLIKDYIQEVTKKNSDHINEIINMVTNKLLRGMVNHINPPSSLLKVPENLSVSVDINSMAVEKYPSEFKKENKRMITRIDRIPIVFKLNNIDTHTKFLLNGNPKFSIDIVKTSYENLNGELIVNKNTNIEYNHSSNNMLNMKVFKDYKRTFDDAILNHISKDFKAQTDISLSDYANCALEGWINNKEIPSIDEALGYINERESEMA